MDKVTKLYNKIKSQLAEAEKVTGELSASLKRNGTLTYGDLQALNDTTEALSNLRDAHIFLTKAMGMPAKDIAQLHNLSQARVSQLCTREKTK
ncbi:MAG: hypothetical protein ACRDBQ_18215 [Shewanella sp.]